MTSPTRSSPSRAFAPLVRVGAVLVAALVPWAAIDDPTAARAVALATAAVVAWLVEALPTFVPTLLLFALAPLLVDGVALRTVLGWGADPLIALFFGGFALGAAATATGLDQRMAELMVRASGGSARRLVLTTAAGGFVTSMWMSGAAAAAVQLTALRPLLPAGTRLQRALLLAVAMGTNFGGMVTPMGAGPNAIAVAAVADRVPMSFVRWMTMALPLAGILVAVATVAIMRMLRAEDRTPIAPPSSAPLDRRQWGLVAVFCCAVVAWVTESWHGVSAPAVALGVAATLFTTGLLRPSDLGRIDWATLLLIAGGLVVGRLLEHGHALEMVSSRVPFGELSQVSRNLIVIGLAALLSALMSNTATATVLIPLAAAFDPSPALPLLIAMGCGLGVPFVISTPPNAMVVGAGAEPRDLLRVGLPLMLSGIAVVALTGEAVLGWLGLSS